jgi:acyl carrier protein
MNAPRRWTYDEVMEKLPALVADCLALEIADVAPDLVFCSDNDSIEILDLNFRCEKAFGIKSPFRLFLGSKDVLSLDDQGRLTEASMQLIRENYPFFAAKFDAGGGTQWTPNDLLAQFTVEMIARFVVQATEQQSAGSQAA